MSANQTSDVPVAGKLWGGRFSGNISLVCSIASRAVETDRSVQVLPTR